MPFDPDVLVLGRSEPTVGLAAEVKARADDKAEARLKEYMLAVGCHVGLFMTPSVTRIFHDTFSEPDEKTIQQVAEVSTADLLGLATPPNDEAGLERALFAWLEQLAGQWWSSLPSAESVRKALLEHIVPAVAEGRVVSTGPR